MSARRAVPLGLASLLASLSMVSPFAIDTFFPSMRAMQAEFGISELAIQQTLTAYLIPYAITSLLHGPLSDALGRRIVVLCCIGLFTVASVLCALAPDFASLLAFRAMQGATAGAGWTVGRAVIRDLYEGPEAQRLMSAVTVIFSLAPAIAPIVGGWIHVGFGWRAAFWLLAVLGFALVLACYRLLPETHPPERRVPLRPRELALASWRILRNPRFLMLALCGSLHFVAVMIYIGSAPAIVLDLWQLRETDFAQLFVPVIAGFSLGALLSGRIAGRLSPTRQIFAGLLLSGVMAAGSLLLNLAWSDPPRLLQQLAMFGTSFGVQLVFPPLTLQVLDLYPAWRGSVASVQSFVQLSISSVVMGAVAPAVDGSMAGIVGISFAAIVAALGCAALARRHGSLAP